MTDDPDGTPTPPAGTPPLGLAELLSTLDYTVGGMGGSADDFYDSAGIDADAVAVLALAAADAARKSRSDATSAAAGVYLSGFELGWRLALRYGPKPLRGPR